jgi:hypothetical protein
MYITEIFSEPPKGYQSDKDDQSITTLSDVRKTRLTLDRISKLRVLNDIKTLEAETKKEKVQSQYAAAPAGDSGPAF